MDFLSPLSTLFFLTLILLLAKNNRHSQYFYVFSLGLTLAYNVYNHSWIGFFPLFFATLPLLDKNLTKNDFFLLSFFHFTVQCFFQTSYQGFFFSLFVISLFMLSNCHMIIVFICLCLFDLHTYASLFIFLLIKLSLHPYIIVRILATTIFPLFMCPFISKQTSYLLSSIYFIIPIITRKNPLNFLILGQHFLLQSQESFLLSLSTFFIKNAQNFFPFILLKIFYVDEWNPWAVLLFLMNLQMVIHQKKLSTTTG